MIGIARLVSHSADSGIVVKIPPRRASVWTLRRGILNYPSLPRISSSGGVKSLKNKGLPSPHLDGILHLR